MTEQFSLLTLTSELLPLSLPQIPFPIAHLGTLLQKLLHILRLLETSEDGLLAPRQESRTPAY
jgi:hypothetical protein